MPQEPSRGQAWPFWREEEGKDTFLEPNLTRAETWGFQAKQCAAVAAKSLQCVRLCNPRDGRPPGSPVPGTLQAGTLEWAAIAFSNA